MKGVEFDYYSRQNITKERVENLRGRLEKVPESGSALAKEVMKAAPPYNSRTTPVMDQIIGEYYQDGGSKPSELFSRQCAAGLLDVYVPKGLQPSYLYIIDKLNQFPYSKGWCRKAVRTASYGPLMKSVFLLLSTYEQFFYYGGAVEDIILRKLDPEVLDYIKSVNAPEKEYFSYLYAAEIDLGNKAVLDALKELISSENNTAYLDRQMILGILRSDNKELHMLVRDLLLAARLQEGLRQTICEGMDEGTIEAFILLLKTVEEHNLIRFSSVKRTVAVITGIFDYYNVDRLSNKMLELMGQCVRDRSFCEEQLKTNDSVAISIALWAKGFYEIQDALRSMRYLIDQGTKNQRLTASFYLNSIYDKEYKKEIAKKVIGEHVDDLELVACFTPVFTEDLVDNIQKLFKKDENYCYYSVGVGEIKDPVLTDHFEDRKEALEMYSIFMEIYKNMPGKGVRFDPCIFPWYQVELKATTVLLELIYISYVLQDEEKITYMAELLGSIKETHYALSKGRMLNLLLNEPKNKRQRELLIGYVGDGKENTSLMACQLVNRLTLEDGEYMILEDMLRFKRSALRKRLIQFLMKQEDSQMKACLKRLLGDKREEKRTAGLDMVLQLSKDQGRTELYEKVKLLGRSIKDPSSREKILINAIYGEREEPEAFYDTNVEVTIPSMEPDREMLHNYFPLTEEEVIIIIKKLDSVIDQNKDFEYITRGGDATLLGNDYTEMKDGSYPLADRILEFYKQEIRNFEVLTEMMDRMNLRMIEFYKAGEDLYKGVFGKLPFEILPFNMKYGSQVERILWNFYKDFMDRHTLFLKSVHVIQALSGHLTSKKLVYIHQSLDGYQQNESINVNYLPIFNRHFTQLENWETDEEFKIVFWTVYQLEMKLRNHEKEGQFLFGGHQTLTVIEPSWFVKAYLMDMIPKDLVYKAIFEYFIGVDSLSGLTHLMGGESLDENKYGYTSFLLGEPFCKELKTKGSGYMLNHTKEGQLYKEIYNTIVSVMVDTELRRGDSGTEFSEYMRGIYYISGISFLTRILMALGNDTLSRDTFYWYGYSNPSTKKEVLSRLLRFCFPAEGEGAADLKERFEDSGVKKSRLVEVAMYAPQWIDIIEEYLGWKGFKSGCYYFMAHMDIGFDERKMAMIAKYTPLSAGELSAGAFDVNWFNQVYKELGEEHFSQLYDAAKYIADGNSHSRARKYADAATGRVKLGDVKKEIISKRNKDLLMSYGLIPFGADKEEDMVGRYEYLQKFLKESKEFGALRRSSEAKAVEIGLLNLSVNAGFSDIMRLTLAMEGRMTEQYKKYMEWKNVGDVEIMLEVSEIGKSQIICRKGEKIMKSVPSKLGKMEYILEIKEVNKALRNQYARTKKMMEEAMENQTFFSADEIAKMYDNPVVKSIVEPLVYICGDGMGFLQKEPSLCLSTFEEKKTPLSPDTKVRVAHPLDFFREQTWHDYQKYLFEKKSKQPFKQIYRELYVKLQEELLQNHSKLFAGNQIQPKKAVACLKARNWIANYQEGLQKVYYKDNIIATIYAYTDWFSPNDVEAPMLEYVEFFDRRTFGKLSIESVPDIIYSEVMRDVDLVVSVAHVGGVDPETSHSTIEMRRAIVEFNLPLFGLTNVNLKEHHAIIKGSRGEYNVHLGSGIVHQMGGSMLNIIPVHSQSRGKLFLPFIDEDPKTAEIMSKIVFLVEDRKIKDPQILKQIV